jgi:hypothetical protein
VLHRVLASRHRVTPDDNIERNVRLTQVRTLCPDGNGPLPQQTRTFGSVVFSWKLLLTHRFVRQPIAAFTEVSENGRKNWPMFFENRIHLDREWPTGGIKTGTGVMQC